MSERPLCVVELAEQAGLHQNTVRDHLRVLEQASLVTSRLEERSGPGRPRRVWLPQPGGPEQEYELVAFALAGSLESHPDGTRLAIESGRIWGRRLVRPQPDGEQASEEACVGRIVELLAERGFAPEAGDRELRMHRCPFRGLARDYPRVVCALHQGLIDGALEELGSPVRVERLAPRSGPDPCVARLAPREPGWSGARGQSPDRC